MAKKTKKDVMDSTIIRWLKRIFSIQTISVIAGLIAAYYTYITYIGNEPSKLSIEYLINDFYYKDSTINFDDKRFFFTSIQSSNGSIDLVDPIYKDKSIATIPRYVNNTNKSITNFRCEIYLYSSWMYYKEDDINHDYEIIERQQSGDVKLRYKYNVLNAHSILPFPLTRVHLSLHDPIAESYNYQPEYTIHLDYCFTYDGIDNPLYTRTEIFSFDNNDLNYNKHQEDYINKMYKEGRLSRKAHTSVVAISNCGKALIADHADFKDEADFEDYKRKLLDRLE